MGQIKKNKREKRNIWLRTILAFGLAVIIVFPLLWMVLGSFKSPTEIFKMPPSIFPRDFSLNGYEMLLQMTDFLVFFRNSFFVSIFSSIIALVLSVSAVYGVTRYKFLGSNAFTYLSLIIYMIPPVLLVIPLYTFWVNVSYSDTLLSLGLSYVALTLPFALWMCRSYFGTISMQMEEAALVDGASRLKAFILVTVPQAIPGLIATFIFTFILAWNEYVVGLILISSQANKTVSLGVADLIGESAMYSWSMLNAAGVLSTIPILILFIFIQKNLVSGMSAGALTGQ